MGNPELVYFVTGVVGNKDCLVIHLSYYIFAECNPNKHACSYLISHGQDTNAYRSTLVSSHLFHDRRPSLSKASHPQAMTSRLSYNNDVHTSSPRRAEHLPAPAFDSYNRYLGTELHNRHGKVVHNLLSMLEDPHAVLCFLAATGIYSLVRKLQMAQEALITVTNTFPQRKLCSLQTNPRMLIRMLLTMTGELSVPIPACQYQLLSLRNMGTSGNLGM